MIQTPDLNLDPRLSPIETQSRPPGPFPKGAAARTDHPPFDASLRKAMLGSPASSRARTPGSSQANGKPSRKASAEAVADQRPDAPRNEVPPRPTALRETAPPRHGVHSQASRGATKTVCADLAAAPLTDSRGKPAEKPVKTDASDRDLAAPVNEPVSEAGANSIVPVPGAEERGSSEVIALTAVVIPWPVLEPMAARGSRGPDDAEEGDVAGDTSDVIVPLFPDRRSSRGVGPIEARNVDGAFSPSGSAEEASRAAVTELDETATSRAAGRQVLPAEGNIIHLSARPIRPQAGMQNEELGEVDDPESASLIQLAFLPKWEPQAAAAPAPREKAVLHEVAAEVPPAEENILPLSFRPGRAQAAMPKEEPEETDDPNITNDGQSSLGGVTIRARVAEPVFSLLGSAHELGRATVPALEGKTVSEEAANQVLPAEERILPLSSRPGGAQAAMPKGEPVDTDDRKITNVIQLPSLLNSQRGDAQAADGTSGAKSSPQMQKREEKSQAAGSAEQTLPQTAGRSSPSADNARSSMEKSHLSSAASMESLFTGSAPINADERIRSEAPAVAEVKQSGPWEQVQLKISNCAVELKRFKADSMSVVLKPDPQTEVCLHLSIHQGVVEVETQFKRGDFAALNAQWDQLQKSLSSQGIRVGPLQEAGSSPATSDSPGTFSRPQRDPNTARDPQEAAPGKPIFVSTSPASRGKAASPPSRLGNRSWESWA